MTVGLRRQIVLRSAWFCAGLVPRALSGFCVRLLGLRTRAPGAAERGRRFVERVFPGVISLVPFGERYYLVRGVRCPARVRPGEEFDVEVVLENAGKETWAGRDGAHPVRLGAWEPPDRRSAFHLPGAWPLADRAGELAADVPPGGLATFRMRFRAPAGAGRYREEFAPVADGLGWFAGERIVVGVGVG